MYITNNNLVALSQPLTTGKEYTHHCNGKTFTDFNHTLVVYHKRQFKTVEWKDLGPKMSVIYLQKTPTQTIQPNQETLQWCLKRYQGFDEQLNQKYFFLHDVDENVFNETSDDIMKLLGISNTIKHGSQHRITTTIEKPTPVHNLENASNVLFFLSTLYGKWDVREIQNQNHLRALTIQLPILSQNTYLLTWFEEMHQHLQSL
jgi:hypothetical protein